jgi:hypothetical protein
MEQLRVLFSRKIDETRRVNNGEKEREKSATQICPS